MKKILLIKVFLVLILISAVEAQTVTDVGITGQFVEYKTVSAAYINHDLGSLSDPQIQFQWYEVDGIGTSYPVGADSQNYTIPSGSAGRRLRLKVSLYDGAAFIDSDSSSLSPVIIVNTPPSATAVSVEVITNRNVGSAFRGKYTYNDVDADPEGSSLYQWRVSSSQSGGGSIIPGATNITYTLTPADTGKWIRFMVTPVAAAGLTPGTVITSSAEGPVNRSPVISNLIVSGTWSPGSTVTASYDYSDPDSDPDASIIEWYRDGIIISGATSLSYNILESDAGSKLKVSITAKSATGYPNTGNTLVSTESTVATSTLPVAEKVCISGRRKVGSELTGRYTYVWSVRDEGTSILEWIVDGAVVATGTNKYTVTSGSVNKTIEFRVTPVSKSPAVTGVAVTSSNPAWFTMARKDFSVSETNIPLTADPSGGEFSGTGVTGSIFNPSSVDVADSPFEIVYLLTLPELSGGCTQRAFVNLSVSSAVVNFSGIDEPYCYEKTSDTIIVKNIPASAIGHLFSLSNPAALIAQLSDSTIAVNPQLMGAGNHKDFIAFRYYDGGIGYMIKSDIVVDSVGMGMIISNLLPYYCQEDGRSTLFGQNLYPAGGMGSWNSSLLESQDNLSAVLLPSLGTPGAKSVTFTYTSPLGCKRSVTQNTYINPSPGVNFSIVDGCIEGPSDTIKFKNETVSTDAVDFWLWDFGDLYDNSSTLFEPGHLYRTAGTRNVKLIATTINGCRDTTIKAIELGIKPQADFYWEDDCFNEGETLKLFDATISQSAITSRRWLFNGTDEVADQLNTSYLKTSSGFLNVDYFVSTSYSNCSDTASKSIFIRPTVKLIEGDYFEDFEGTQVSWAADNSPLNSWLLGTPDRLLIDNAYSGNNAWYTSFSKTNQVKASYGVEGPCFDFTGVARPMITLKLMKVFDKNRDGGALQYKIGNSLSWEHIGTLEDGIKWYNSVLISGKPGGTQIGWTTVKDQDTAWIEARQNLDILNNKKDVKLRIVYGSDGTSQLNDGMGFDDIFIGERTRTVLVEHFTNASSTTTVNANQVLNNLVAKATRDAVNIQYHTDYPGSDIFYNDNSADPSARSLFYGLSKIPYTLYGGGTLISESFASRFDYVIREADSLDLKKRAMIDPAFKISLAANIQDGNVVVSGNLTALRDLDQSNLTLYVAVVANRINEDAGTNSETLFRNVLRKMLPSAGGTILKKVWTKGESLSFGDFSWVIENVYDATGLEVIVFVQNNNSKEVFQTSSSGLLTLVTSIGDYMIPGKGLGIYPNPTSGILKIDFESPSVRNSKIYIFNQTGSLSKTLVVEEGITGLRVEDLNLPPGFYIIKLYEGARAVGYAKLVVTKR